MNHEIFYPLLWLMGISLCNLPNKLLSSMFFLLGYETLGHTSFRNHVFCFVKNSHFYYISKNVTRFLMIFACSLLNGLLLIHTSILKNGWTLYLDYMWIMHLSCCLLCNTDLWWISCKWEKNYELTKCT